MNENNFRKMIEYNDWANRRVLKSFKDQAVADEFLLKLLSHILRSEQVWMLRMEGGEYLGINIWSVADVAESEALLESNEKAYKTLIHKREVTETVSYKNTKGVEYSTSVNDILTHVSLHSAYHRGQIAREMRRLGKEPAVTDYIAFVRSLSGSR